MKNQPVKMMFLYTPSIELEFNIAKLFRVGAGVNYRFVFGTGLPGYINNEFSGPGGFLSFRFGWFKLKRELPYHGKYN